MSKPTSMPRSRIILCTAALAALLTGGCVAAAVGAGAFAVAITTAVVASSCDEPVSVQVWDGVSAYPVCDATVTAKSEGHVVSFSPCYQAYLGEGTWVVKASRGG